jgi:hypothetical protein
MCCCGWVLSVLLLFLSPCLQVCWLFIYGSPFFFLQNLKQGGTRFPGRDVESLAPIFTPAQSAPITTPQAAPQGLREEAPPLTGKALAAKSKETFEVARNSIELLNTVLTSSPKEETLKVGGCLVALVLCRLEVNLRILGWWSCEKYQLDRRSGCYGAGSCKGVVLARLLMEMRPNSLSRPLHPMMTSKLSSPASAATLRDFVGWQSGRPKKGW